MPRIARSFRRLLRCREGATAVEFAIVMPLLLVVSLGALEMSLLMFEMHNANDATRRGVREAVIQYPIVVSSDITTSGILCTSTSSTVSCSGGATIDDDTRFTAIYNKMKPLLPDLTQDDIEVLYRDTGLTSNGVVTPTVTLIVKNLTYKFFIAAIIPGFDGVITLPGFRSTRVMSSGI